MYADGASQSPLGVVAEAGTSAAGNGGVFEASVVLPAPDSPPEATPVNEPSLGDDAVVDSSPARDSLAMALESGIEGATSPSSCDQDGDGYLATGTPCFGNDCCDTDPNVHPGQTAYFTSPSQCGSYDYNCDGIATPEYAVANCQWVGLGCTGDGFVDITACGVTASFSVCTSTSALTCAASVGSLTQACR
jgi:hypothetical protein